MGAPDDQDAPALAECVVDVIDLQRDFTAGCRSGPASGAVR